MADDNNSKFSKSNSFSILVLTNFIFLTLAFSITSQILTFSSVLATSSNNNNNEGNESDSDQTVPDDDNGDTTSASDDNQQRQESDTDKEFNGENSNNDNDQSPTESQNAATTSSQGLTQQNNNQIQPNTLRGSVGIQERPRDNAVLTPNFTNTLVPIEPDPNLESSLGNLEVIMNVECKSTNGSPSDKAVCDTFTKEPEFIQPKDYSLTLDITRDGANYKSTFPGNSEGQSFTIKPGDFEIKGALHRDAYDVVAKIGAYSQLDGVDLTSSATGDCNIVNLPPGNVYGELQVKGDILPLTNIVCTIHVEVNYYDIELPKTQFGDMLQNQRIPDVIIQK